MLIRRAVQLAVPAETALASRLRVAHIIINSQVTIICKYESKWGGLVLLDEEFGGSVVARGDLVLDDAWVHPEEVAADWDQIASVGQLG